LETYGVPPTMNGTQGATLCCISDWCVVECDDDVEIPRMFERKENLTNLILNYADNHDAARLNDILSKLSNVV